jgi:hypothetical protein
MKSSPRPRPKRSGASGDSFHDRHGCDRLPEEARALLTGLTARTRWHWIVGNHDPGFAGTGVAVACGGEFLDEAEVDGLILRHEADPAETRPELSAISIPNCGSPIAAGWCRGAASSPPRPSSSSPLRRAHRRPRRPPPEIVRAVGAGAEALVPVQGPAAQVSDRGLGEQISKLAPRYSAWQSYAYRLWNSALAAQPRRRDKATATRP